MQPVLVLGVLASIASMTSFVPQAVRVARRGETGDLSPATYAITVTGFALWVGYGLELGEWPIIVTNTVCGLLAGSILLMIIRDRVRRRFGSARALDTEARAIRGARPTSTTGSSRS